MHSFRKGWRINRRQKLTQTNSVFGTMEQSMTSQCLDIGGKLPACGSDFRSPEQAQQRRQMLYRRESNGPQHSSCYHTTAAGSCGAAGQRRDGRRRGSRDFRQPIAEADEGGARPPDCRGPLATLSSPGSGFRCGTTKLLSTSLSVVRLASRPRTTWCSAAPAWRAASAFECVAT